MNNINIIIICIIGIVVIAFLYRHKNVNDLDKVKDFDNHIDYHMEHIMNIVEDEDEKLNIVSCPIVQDRSPSCSYGQYIYQFFSPWWNSNSLRHTRNMSYDLRGDVPQQYPYYIGPWCNLHTL